MKKLLKFLHMLFWGSVLMIAALVMVLFFIEFVEGDEITDVLPYAGIVAVVLLSWYKVIAYDCRKSLRYAKVPIIRIENAMFLLAAFLFIVVITALAALFTRLDMQEGVADPSSVHIVRRSFHAILLFVEAVFAWTQISNIPFVGVGYYLRSWLKFVKKHLPVVMAYQVGIALISLLCGIVVTLASKDASGSVRLAAASYFFYVMESGSPAVTEISAQVIGMLSSLTAASSYFVLSSIAWEFFKEQEISESLQKVSFFQRFKRMLFEKDTIRLLVMTMLCIAVMLMPSLAAEQTSLLFMAVLAILWLISLVSFLRQTNFMMFFLTYTVLNLFEKAIHLPEITGVESMVWMILLVLLRLILFSFMALCVGFNMYTVERLNGQTTGEQVTKWFGKLSILQVGALAAGAVYAVKAIPEMAVETVKEKIGGHKKV